MNHRVAQQCFATLGYSRLMEEVRDMGRAGEIARDQRNRPGRKRVAAGSVEFDDWVSEPSRLGSLEITRRRGRG